MKHFYSILSFLLLFGFQHLNAQESQSLRFYQPEIVVGTVVPNYMNYPSAGARFGAAITIGKQDTIANSFNHYYNFPKTGIHLGLHTLGNDSIYGQEISLMPTLELKTKRNGFFRLGFGASYYTKTYRDSKRNLAVGSNLTWGFQLYYYRNVIVRENANLKLGAGFLHGSNGHLQLPNYGINSAVLSVSLQHLSQNSNLPTRERNKYKGERQWVYSHRVGIGWHELGSTVGPVGGEKKAVYNGAFAAGIIFKRHFKLMAGFGYRYYQHYADYIDENIADSTLNAHNVYFTLGGEFMLRHVGIVLDGGINLYKPFYPYFVQEFESADEWSYILKKLFLSRVGFNFYLKDVTKSPTNNLFIATTMHANFGQADFSGVSIGYLRTFGQ